MNYQIKKDHDAREFSLFQNVNCKTAYHHPEKRANVNLERLTLSNLVRIIESGNTLAGCNIKDTCTRIRSTTDSNLKASLKRELPCVTLSVVCNNENRTDNFLSSSGLLQIDIDYKDNETILSSPELLLELTEKLKKDLYVVLLCKSPSNGLKIITHYDKDTTHKTAFIDAERYFYDAYKLTIDKSCKDIARLMFLSFDPDVYVNYKAAPLKNTPIVEVFESLPPEKKNPFISILI